MVKVKLRAVAARAVEGRGVEVTGREAVARAVVARAVEVTAVARAEVEWAVGGLVLAARAAARVVEAMVAVPAAAVRPAA